MNKLNIKGDDLLELGYPKGKAIGTAIRVIEQHLKNEEREEVMAILLKVFQYPESFLDDAVLSPIANELVIKPKMEDGVPVTQLKENPNGYAIYGKQHIEKGAIDQMEI